MSKDVANQKILKSIRHLIVSESGEKPEVHFTQVTSNSAKVNPGAVFVAIRGTKTDGHQFIESAIDSGAICIIGEAPIRGLKKYYLQVRDSREALGILASEFSGNPSLHMKVVGVTGTSGKTTTTYLIESILRSANLNPGLIGTIETRFNGKRVEAENTTPGSEQIQELLKEMKEEGSKSVVMEVSSHALKQHRVKGIAFDVSIFTNLTPEHLDYHPDMDDYFEAKKLLFTAYASESEKRGKRPRFGVHIAGDYGKKLSELIPHEYLLEYDVESSAADLRYSSLELSLEGIRGEIVDERGLNIPVHSSLIGAFNAENILAAVSAGVLLKLPVSVIANGIHSLKSVPGRLERVGDRKIHVFVDYAHKPDALEKVLVMMKSLARQSGGRLITVFGCGGDRDRKKRPVMGASAARHSDQVIVTSDNPRSEEPNSVIREILTGISSEELSRVVVEPDRRKAIFQSIKNAREGDVVIIAGKGHEDYQIIAKSEGGTMKIHFDDREVAREAIMSKNE